MSKMSFEKTKIGDFIARRGFFVALAVCLVAIGAAGWIAMGSLMPPADDTGENTISSPVSYEDTSETQSTHDVGNTVSGIPVESDVSSIDQSNVTESSDSSVDAVPSATSEAAFFVLPVNGDIVKQFSDTKLQYSETCRDWRLHPAIDIAAQKGDKVNAAGEGKVTEIYTDSLWGTTIVIDHGNGLIAYYCGLEKNVKVKTGDIVDVNQCIGVVDTVPCECIDAVHLHFSMKKNDKWMSPLQLMGLLVEEESSAQ